MMHSNGQTSRVEYCEDVKVCDIDQNEESEEEKEENNEERTSEVKLFRVDHKYDFVETEIKLLHKTDYLHLMVRPYKNDSTKVIMWVAGKEVRQEIVFENKSYKGTLQEEPATFSRYSRDLNFELGFKGDPYKLGHYTFKVENLPIEYLKEAPKPERPSFDIARSEIKVNMSGMKPGMKFPFIVRGKFMNLVIYHNRLTKFTKV